MDWKIFILEFIDKFFNSSFVAILVGGSLASYFGFQQYKKQKNLEKIDDKYFKDGFDGLIKYLSRTREVLEDNYSSSLMILRYFRDLDYDKFIEWFEKNSPYALKTVSSKMPYAFFIVASLMDDRDFKLNLEKLFAKLQHINDYYISDLVMCLKNYKNKNNNADNKKKFYDKLVNESVERNKSIEDIYLIIGYLELILLESRKMDISKYRDIDKIRENTKILGYLKQSKEALEQINKNETTI